MKSFKKTASIIASAFISVCFLAGCSHSVVVKPDDIINKDEFIRDINVAPVQSAAYEQYTKQAIDAYYAVADNHLDSDGAVDIEDKEVIAAATTAAAKLFAYACYNERQLDKYVYFLDQDGTTNISAGSGKAIKQEYFLRINETDETCGYKYHYTIKKVIESSGAISVAKSQFESAKTRIVVDTDTLYRLKGSNLEEGNIDDGLDVDGDGMPDIAMLKCEWKTDDDWGITDKTRLVKRDFVEPEDIAADIVESADDEDEITIRANINILAENIVKHAIIVKDEDEEKGFQGYFVIMSVDTAVANEDEASLTMLRNANSSKNCTWVNDGKNSGLTIAFRIWENGLFRLCAISEKWQGNILAFSGVADSSTTYYFSYSDRDCDMSKYLAMLEEVKASKGE